MPIARKPKINTVVSEKVISDVIQKGGSVPAEKTKNIGKKEQTVNLRLPGNILDEIDLAVTSRRLKTSRHTWLMEAIIEKLDRESSL